MQKNKMESYLRRFSFFLPFWKKIILQSLKVESIICHFYWLLFNFKMNIYKVKKAHFNLYIIFSILKTKK